MDNISLEQLFDEAMKYGRISIHQCKEDKRFSATIRFNTIDHVELEACSGFNHKTIRSALLAAIEKAVVIVESMRRSASVDTEHTQEMLGIKNKILKLIGKE